MFASIRRFQLSFALAALVTLSGTAHATFELIPDTVAETGLVSPATRLLAGHWSGVIQQADYRTVIHLWLDGDTEYRVQFQTVSVATGQVMDQGMMEGSWCVIDRTLELMDDQADIQSLPFLLDGDELTLRFSAEDAAVKMQRHRGAVVEYSTDPTNIVMPLPYSP